MRQAGGAGRAGIMENNCFLEDLSMKRRDMVKGTEVHDMVINCSRTMVQQELVSDNKMRAEEDIMVCCAHGDIVKYPLRRLGLRQLCSYFRGLCYAALLKKCDNYVQEYVNYAQQFSDYAHVSAGSHSVACFRVR